MWSSMTGLWPYFGQQPKLKLCLHQALHLSATASPVPERSHSPRSTMQYIRKVTNDDAASTGAGHRCFRSQQTLLLVNIACLRVQTQDTDSVTIRALRPSKPLRLLGLTDALCAIVHAKSALTSCFLTASAEGACRGEEDHGSLQGI